MIILYFFLFLWVIFSLLDPDPDPATQINADPCESGSATLKFTTIREEETPVRNRPARQRLTPPPHTFSGFRADPPRPSGPPPHHYLYPLPGCNIKRCGGDERCLDLSRPDIVSRNWIPVHAFFYRTRLGYLLHKRMVLLPS
jgi:hypothetical protein